VEVEAQISMLIYIPRFSLLYFRGGQKDMRGGHDEGKNRLKFPSHEKESDKEIGVFPSSNEQEECITKERQRKNDNLSLWRGKVGFHFLEKRERDLWILRSIHFRWRKPEEPLKTTPRND